MAVVSGAALLGVWISSGSENKLVQEAGSEAAAFVETVLAPSVDKFNIGETWTATAVAALARDLKSPSYRSRVASTLIWSLDGALLYDADATGAAGRFPASENFLTALTGDVAERLVTAEEAPRGSGQSGSAAYLEVHAPLRNWRGEIIAVVEFKERAERLSRSLAEAQRQIWLVCSVMSLLVVLAFYALMIACDPSVARRAALTAQAVRSPRDALTDHAAGEDRRPYPDTALRQLGAELHDGPAQLVSLALLRLETLDAPPRSGERRRRADGDLDQIRLILRDAVREIRSLSAGLLAPEIGAGSLDLAILDVIARHELRTGTVVERRVSHIPGTVPHNLKVCLCRVVQEGLTNAFRHAGGASQLVVLERDDEGILLEVRDGGSGAASSIGVDLPRLGLVGIQERVRSLGGVFVFESGSGQGACLRVHVPFRGTEL